MDKVIFDLIGFFKATEKLKLVIRHSYLSDGKRLESVAEHTWMLCLYAVSLAPHIKLDFDLLKTLKMLIVHDLGEIVAGDIQTGIKDKMDKAKVYEAERQGFVKVIESLPQEQTDEYLQLWDEFEVCETNEAKVAFCLDKLEASIQHNISGPKTWDQADFDVHPYYKSEFYDIDPVFRQIKDAVDKWSMELIEQNGALGRIDEKHIEKFKK